jgi:uncharacterized protein
MIDSVMIWRRLDIPGHESARLVERGSEWHLSGTAVFLHEGQPCRLNYLVVCDANWRTVSGNVSGWVGDRDVEVECSAYSGIWRLNGDEYPQVEGCTDLDLNFSPSTNLLPIRRLGLAVGQQAAVRAAWLRFPGFVLEPLEQIYQHVAEGTYRYESAGGRFVRELSVNGTGFVTLYPGLWQAET